MKFNLKITFMLILVCIYFSYSLETFTNTRRKGTKRNLLLTPNPYKKIPYTRLLACKNLIWNETHPDKPKIDNNELERKYIKGKGNSANYFKVQTIKDNHGRKVKEYNKLVEQVTTDPKPSLNFRLDQNDGNMPTGCKYPFAYRAFTDLKITLQCGFKTDIIKHIPLEYPKFKYNFYKVFKSINKEYEHTRSNGYLKKGLTYFIGYLKDVNFFKKGQKLIMNSYMEAYMNKCVLYWNREHYGGSEVIVEVRTSKHPLKALNMKTCVKEKSKLLFLVSRGQCFDVVEVKKETTKSCENKEISFIKVIVETNPCRKKLALVYKDFPFNE